MSSIADQEDLVKEELFKFLRKYIPSAQLSQIDEIVLSYVVSILEELGADLNGGEDAFDVEEFCEMMAAYLPEFSIIGPDHVCSWMFELAASLSQNKTNIAAEAAEVIREAAESSGASSHGSEGSAGSWESSKRTHQLSETSDTSSDSGDFMTSQEEHDYIRAQLQLLQEMFPAACSLEVRHCLAIAGGDPGRAAQLVLHRQEAGQSLTPHTVLQSTGVRSKPKVDDQELKERIIARYSYIDQAESAREHRPVAPKSEPKKLIRYRDNKIVSLKGERFSEVKKDDEDGEVKSLKQPKQRPN